LSRPSFGLSIVLVLLFIGDVLSLFVFISIPSITKKQTKIFNHNILIYVNYIHIDKNTNKTTDRHENIINMRVKNNVIYEYITKKRSKERVKREKK